MRKSKCACCDKPVSIPSLRGWCDECEQEFESMQKNIHWECKEPEKKCTTPYSCAIAKKCCYVVAINSKEWENR